jgi:phosphoglycolate phosphatase-like HAD superfamily hydrolase
MTDFARPTVLLFDVDGTLLDCGGAGRAAMQRAFAEVVGRDDVCDFPFAGSTDRAIARRGLSEAGLAVDEPAIDAFLARYLAHLESALEQSRRYAVLRGVVALLDALAAVEGFAIGLGTGNVEAGAFAKLRRGDLHRRFTFGGYGSDHEDRARLLAIGAARGAARLGAPLSGCRVIVIGDTDRDVAAARAIGADCLGVGTGPMRASELLAVGATTAVDDLAVPEARAFLGV